MEEELAVPTSQVNLDELETNAEIAELTQQGNFLVGVTNKGVHFRQYIPQYKILNKVNGKFVLEDMVIRETA